MNTRIFISAIFIYYRTKYLVSIKSWIYCKALSHYITCDTTNHCVWDQKDSMGHVVMGWGSIHKQQWFSISLPWSAIIIVRSMSGETPGTTPAPLSAPPFPHMVLQPFQHGPMELLSGGRNLEAIFLRGAQTTFGNTWFCWRNLVSLSASDTTNSKGSCLLQSWFSSCNVPSWGLRWGLRKATSDSLITPDCTTQLKRVIWLAN